METTSELHWCSKSPALWGSSPPRAPVSHQSLQCTCCLPLTGQLTCCHQLVDVTKGEVPLDSVLMAGRRVTVTLGEHVGTQYTVRVGHLLLPSFHTAAGYRTSYVQRQPGLKHSQNIMLRRWKVQMARWSRGDVTALVHTVPWGPRLLGCPTVPTHGFHLKAQGDDLVNQNGQSPQFVHSG
jgi:hypothetical protein